MASKKLLTYAEQLKHPNWQKKRLEMLEAAQWECTNCGCKDTTLHVHHKQYIKGRMAWEYDFTELAVLCEPCHETEHADEKTLKEILLGSNTSSIAGLVAGFNNRFNDWIDPALIATGRDRDPMAYASGFVAFLTYQLGDIDKMLLVARFAASLHREDAEANMIFTHSRGNTFGEDL